MALLTLLVIYYSWPIYQSKSSNQLGSEELTEFCAAVAIAGSQRVDAHLRVGGFRGLS